MSKSPHEEYQHVVAQMLSCNPHLLSCQSFERFAQPPSELTVRSRQCVNELQRAVYDLLAEANILRFEYGAGCIAHDFVTQTVALQDGYEFQRKLKLLKEPRATVFKPMSNDEQYSLIDRLDASNLILNEHGLYTLEHVLKTAPQIAVMFAAARMSGKFIGDWEPGLWTRSGGEIIGYAVNGIMENLPAHPTK